MLHIMMKRHAKVTGLQGESFFRRLRQHAQLSRTPQCVTRSIEFSADCTQHTSNLRRLSKRRFTVFDRLFNFKPLNLANSIILVVLVLIIVGAVSMVACSSNIASPRPEIVSSRQAASSARLSPKGQRKPVSSHTPAPQKRLRDLLPLTASP